mgnify:CR=1 FL=1
MMKKKPIKAAAKKKSISKNKSLPPEKKKPGKIKAALKNPAIPSSVKPAKDKIPDRYVKIIDNIRECYFEIDLSGNFTFMNDAVCHTLGYSKKKLMGADSRQFIDKDDEEKIRKIYSRVRKTGKSCKGLNWHIKRKDGMKRYLEGSISLLKNSAGKPTGYFVIANDFTERIEAERLLRDREERLRGITASLPGVIFQFYAKDNGEYGLNYVSEPVDEFSRILTDEEIENIDMTFPSFLSRIHEDDRERFLTSIDNAVKNLSPWTFEGRLLKSGRII